MENYKVLNTELIGKVQEMKMQIAVYQKEVVELRKKYMEERHIRLEMQQQLLIMLACNFQNTVKEVDPSVDILQLLVKCGGVKDLVNSSKAERDDPSERHSSAEVLTRELRRSIAVQQRVSVVRRSPVKRSSYSATSRVGPQECYEFESEENSQNEEEEDSEVADAGMQSEKYNCTPEQAEEQRSVLEDIYESKEDTEEELIDRQDTEIDLYSSAIKHSLIRSKDKFPLRDVSNQQSKPPEAEASMRSMQSLSPVLPESHVVTRRGKRHSFRENNSIEGARFLPNFCGQSSDCELTPPGEESHTICGSNEDWNARSPSSLGLSDISIGNFVSAPCSTPSNLKQKENTLRRQNLRSQQKIANTPIKTNITVDVEDRTTLSSGLTLTLTSLSSIRPQRKCKPTNLTEPSLSKKLRNVSNKKIK